MRADAARGGTLSSMAFDGQSIWADIFCLPDLEDALDLLRTEARKGEKWRVWRILTICFFEEKGSRLCVTTVRYG